MATKKAVGIHDINIVGKHWRFMLRKDNILYITKWTTRSWVVILLAIIGIAVSFSIVSETAYGETEDGFDYYIIKDIYGYNNSAYVTDFKGGSNAVVPAKLGGADVVSIKITNHENLVSLDVTACSKLSSLNCPQNNLSTLDVSKNIELNELDCSINQLTALDVSKNTSLCILHCRDNSLSLLDVSANVGLISLRCSSNKLADLVLSNHPSLYVLDCSHNRLSTIDISKSTPLKYLFCYGNQLQSLDVSNNIQLSSLYCYSNRITTLDLSKNTALELLYCSDNLLTALDVSKNVILERLNCVGNKITSFIPDINTLIVRFSAWNIVSQQLPLLSEAAITIPDQIWTGEALTPAPVVEYNGETLVAGVDYVVISYLNHVKVGKARVTLTGRLRFGGDITKTFRIIPPKTTVTRAVVGKGSLKITWKKIPCAKNMSGQQIRFRKVGQTKWKYVSHNAKDTSRTLSGLKKGKRYQVQVRAYKGDEFYAPWSAIKTSGKIK